MSGRTGGQGGDASFADPGGRDATGVGSAVSAPNQPDPDRPDPVMGAVVRAEVQVLCVCRANQFRSVAAAALLALAANDAALQWGERLRVVSAGTDAIPGRRPLSAVVSWLAERGLDVAAHPAHRLEPADVAASDLVLTMTRSQLREVILLEPAARTRAFTLPELVRRLAADGPREPDEPLRSLAARLAAERPPGDLLGSGGRDDLEEPPTVGGLPSVLRRMAELIDAATSALWPRRPAEGALSLAEGAIARRPGGDGAE